MAKVCSMPGCPVFVPSGASPRCAAHPYEDRRPSASARGYDRKWSMNAARYLRAHPVCARCGALSTVADHVVPRAELLAAGVEQPDAWDRLQPLCRRCHHDKTTAETVSRRSSLRAIESR